MALRRSHGPLSAPWFAAYAFLNGVLQAKMHDNHIVGATLAGRIRITAGESRLRMVSDEETRYLVPVGRHVFREELSNDRVVFEQDKALLEFPRI